jgi:flagellar hook-associated protein 1 FlgK
MTMLGILGNALSGLNVAQTQIRTASHNISNVNTPGFVRSVAEPVARTLDGRGAGADLTNVRRAVDEFLSAATIRARASNEAAGARADAIGRVSAFFSTPDEPGSLSGRVNAALAALTPMQNDPASTLLRNRAVAAISDVLSNINALSREVAEARLATDQEIIARVGRANDLLTRISELNGDISRGRVMGDGTGAENAQSTFINELAAIIDVKVQPRPGGGVIVRTANGVLLAGEQPGQLSYTGGTSAAPGATFGQITLAPPFGGQPEALDPNLSGGSLRGLLTARDVDFPDIADALGNLAGGLADALNVAHADSVSAPPARTLTGRNTGLLGSDSIGFTGKATLATATANGALTRRVDVDFAAGSISVNGGPVTSFGTTVASFTAAINTALSPNAAASFTNGVMSLQAVAGQGVMIQQDPAAPSDRGGRGFAAFFGLNQLIVSDRPAFFDTGLTAGAAHGLAPGGTIGFRVYDVAGRQIAEPVVSVTGTTMGDMVDALNTGLAGYAVATLDERGAIQLSGVNGAAAHVLSDTTVRTGVGVSFTQLFGLGAGPRAGRAQALSVRADIAADPGMLSLGKADLAGAAVGAIVTARGDSRGAQALSGAIGELRRFDAAAGLSASFQSVAGYSGTVLGLVGSRAASARDSADSTRRFFQEADFRRASVEAVNLDEELASLTQYQQAYNANARLIAAAQDMMDELLRLV